MLNILMALALMTSFFSGAKLDISMSPAHIEGKEFLLAINEDVGGKVAEVDFEKVSFIATFPDATCSLIGLDGYSNAYLRLHYNVEKRTAFIRMSSSGKGIKELNEAEGYQKGEELHYVSRNSLITSVLSETDGITKLFLRDSQTMRVNGSISLPRDVGLRPQEIFAPFDENHKALLIVRHVRPSVVVQLCMADFDTGKLQEISQLKESHFSFGTDTGDSPILVEFEEGDEGRNEITFWDVDGLHLRKIMSYLGPIAYGQALGGNLSYVDYSTSELWLMQNGDKIKFDFPKDSKYRLVQFQNSVGIILWRGSELYLHFPEASGEFKAEQLRL